MRNAEFGSRAFVVLSILFGLTACGGSTPPPETAANNTAQAGDVVIEEGHNDPSSRQASNEKANADEDSEDTVDVEAEARAWPRGGGSKQEQCSALVAVINDGVDAIGAASGQREGDKIGEELRRMSAAMAEFANRTSKVRLSDAKLIRFAIEYRLMTSSSSRHARGMADAADTGKIAEMKRENAALDKAVSKEDPLVDAINEYCQ